MYVILIEYRIRECVRGVAGVVRATTPIFQLLLHKTSSPKALKPLNPQGLKPLRSQAIKPPSPQTLKPTSPQALKPLIP